MNGLEDREKEDGLVFWSAGGMTGEESNDNHCGGDDVPVEAIDNRDRCGLEKFARVSLGKITRTDAKVWGGGP
jgi:hypothetical protein